LMDMQTYALNAAVDVRRWAKTEVSPLREGQRPKPPAPTREEEQRYNQTAPQRADSKRSDHESSRSISSRNATLAGLALAPTRLELDEQEQARLDKIVRARLRP
jgi:hypothetical protein